MSTLKLKLNIWLDTGVSRVYPRFGVITNIYDALNKRRRKQELVIPVDDYYDIRIAPGQYIIEVLLPSGRVIYEEVSVEKTIEPQELQLEVESSPHEWLSWQQFFGNVDQKKYASLERKQVVSIRATRVSVQTRIFTRDKAFEESEKHSLVSQGYFFDIPSLKKVNRGRSVSIPFPFDSLDPSIVWIRLEPSQPSDSDSLSELHMFGNSNHRYRVNYHTENFPRNYLFIYGTNIPAQYCVLPIPWIGLNRENVATVEALIYHVAVEESSKIDPGYRVSVVVRDGLVGALLGYLGVGNLPSAAKIMKKYEDYFVMMLKDKVVNPIAAAAGAYVLLTLESKSDQFWHEWICNLMNWFPWLPDGAIQYAWTILAKSDASIDEKKDARASLLEGYHRGLPFYSKGVRLLLDGLQLFANDSRASGKPDQEVEAALKRIWLLASRTNTRQLFTTVLLG